MVAPIQTAPITPTAPVTPVVPAPVTPVVDPNAPVTPVAPVEKPPTIQERLAAFKPAPTEPAPDAVIDPYEVAGYNRNDIEKITDPVARQQVENMAKSWQGAYTKKFTALADERKAFETERATPVETAWTVERLQREAVKPDFLRAAQQVSASLKSSPAAPASDDLSDEQLSALSPAEKQQLDQAQAQSRSLQTQLNDLQRQNEEAALKGRYASYDPNEIEKLRQGLINGDVRATREHLYKVAAYDRDIERAYEMGQKDAQNGITEKVSVSSPAGTTVTTPNTVPARQEKESGLSYFKRLAEARLAQFRNRTPSAT